MRGCEELAHAAADRQPETGTAADRRLEAEPVRTRRAEETESDRWAGAHASPGEGSS